MFAGLKHRLWLTEGEKGVFLAYVALAIFGAGMAHTVVNDLGGDDVILRKLSVWDVWMIFAGAIGADIGLFSARHSFGNGVRTALWGACIVTGVATVIGGTLALPGYGTMFGPFAVFVTFWSSPLLFLFWCIMLLAVHLLFLKWRQERETIYASPKDNGLPA